MEYGPRWRSSRTVNQAKPVGQDCSAGTRLSNYTVSQNQAIGRLRVHAVILTLLSTGYLVSTLVEGRRLRVHLFDTSLSPPQLLAHTCGNSPCIAIARSAEASRVAASPPTLQSTTPYRAYAQPTSTYAVQPVSPYTTSTVPVMPAAPPSFVPPAYSMQALEAKIASMGMNTSDPAVMAAGRTRLAQAYAQQAVAQQQPIQNLQNQAQLPVYVPTATGTYVNVGRGAIKTEIRGIFVSNIDYKANSKDILQFFRRAGEIVRCQLQKDPVSGKSKGNATVQYAAANDAKKAVEMFNNEKYMSMRLKVRLDKEPVAVGAPSASSSRTNGSARSARPSQTSRNNTEPIIANGSVCQ